MASEGSVVKHEIWQNCYAHGWAEGELIGAAFEHPAKMARGLVYRIVSEGLKRGWWTKEGWVIVDDTLLMCLTEELDKGLYQRIE